MFAARQVSNRGGRDEAEKPFWISFADLMTALMVMFLIVMGVALLAVTKDGKKHEDEISKILERFEEAAKRHKGITVDKDRQVINFGERAQFAFGDWRLNADQEEVIRKFVPEIVALANEELGKSILKRIVVEGYTDKKGTYLSNLNLSLQRSQRVVCSLFATTGPSLLSKAQKEDARSLFFVGGYSFNAAKDTAEESRRVEMRLEFLGIGERRASPPASDGNFGDCALR
ncbi:OmpA family protein [Paucibacter sp. B2R-40]|uniref:OmpA/MotB family protein n=1 Tax=Paucibacter sp. B2R-40 TaxID=2893554 RepID=UPI0021E42A69|nr:OmpA family protein [Paucibacter sp. B2R-40]MCV2355376.1 OmpA family protein [Paucibacter sp. B2R-40]